MKTSSALQLVTQPLWASLHLFQVGLLPVQAEDRAVTSAPVTHHGMVLQNPAVALPVRVSSLEEQIRQQKLGFSPCKGDAWDIFINCPLLCFSFPFLGLPCASYSYWTTCMYIPTHLLLLCALLSGPGRFVLWYRGQCFLGTTF